MRLVSLCLGALLVVSCSEAEPVEETQGLQNEVAQTAGDDAVGSIEDDNANPFAQDQSAPAAAIIQCPDDPGLSCAGQLRIRAIDGTLSQNRKRFVARGSLEMTNSSGEAVELAFLRTNPSFRLANGAALDGDAARVFSGRDQCSINDDPAECYAKYPENFVMLEQGDSPLRINYEFSSNVEASLLPSMSDVDRGTLNFSVYIVDASGSARRRDVSINDVPITARLDG